VDGSANRMLTCLARVDEDPQRGACQLWRVSPVAVRIDEHDRPGTSQTVQPSLGRASRCPYGCRVPMDSWTKIADVATVVMAAATCAAVIAAVVAGRYAARLLGVERARDDRAENQRLRWQAERVAAWWVYPDDLGHLDAGLWIGNYSGLPMRAVQVRTAIIVDERSAAFFGEYLQDVLPPSGGDGLYLGKASDFPAMVAYRKDHPTAPLSTNIVFTDSGGRVWTRDPFGNLSHTPASNTIAFTATTSSGAAAGTYTITSPEPKRWWPFRAR
jgi:hypothetical protein